MTSLKAQQGQAILETMWALVVMLLILVPGIILMIHGLGSFILTKWASSNSHCMAQSRPQDECIRETTHSLMEHFALRDIKIHTRSFRGIIHSDIEAHLLKQTLMGRHNGFTLIKGSYDLEPSEYRRVK